MAQPVKAAIGSGPARPPSQARPVHGGIKPEQLRALGLKPEEVLDFSASVSPLGPPAGLAEALRGVDLTAYPDPACLELREALAGHLSGSQAGRITPEQVLPGNGSTELIHLLARAFLAPPFPTQKKDGASPGHCCSPPLMENTGGLACWPAARSQNWKPVGTRDSAGTWWKLAGALPGLLLRPFPRPLACQSSPVMRDPVWYSCVIPNNPTGIYLARKEVEALAQACAQSGALLVVDEAYLNFVDSPWDSLDLLEGGNTVLLRSMTKDYALTGLRLGYSWPLRRSPPGFPPSNPTGASTAWLRQRDEWLWPTGIIFPAPGRRLTPPRNT